MAIAQGGALVLAFGLLPFGWLPSAVFIAIALILHGRALYIELIVHKPLVPIMKKTVLLSFSDANARDKFFETLRSVSESLSADGESISSDLIIDALKTVQLDPPVKADHERAAVLYVTGQKMAEGSLSDMRRRFQQEIDSHKGNVELRELRNGQWEVILKRRLQK